MCRCAQDEVIDVNKKCAKKTSTVAFYMYPGGPPSSNNKTQTSLSSNISHRPGYHGPASSYPVVGFPSPDSKFNQIVTANQMTVNLGRYYIIKTGRVQIQIQKGREIKFKKLAMDGLYKKSKNSNF